MSIKQAPALRGVLSMRSKTPVGSSATIGGPGRRARGAPRPVFAVDGTRNLFAA
jgi:hypothetical protein